MINLVPYELIKHIKVKGSKCGSNHIFSRGGRFWGKMDKEEKERNERMEMKDVWFEEKVQLLSQKK